MCKMPKPSSCVHVNDQHQIGWSHTSFCWRTLRRAYDVQTEMKQRIGRKSRMSPSSQFDLPFKNLKSACNDHASHRCSTYGKKMGMMMSFTKLLYQFPMIASAVFLGPRRRGCTPFSSPPANNYLATRNSYIVWIGNNRDQSFSSKVVQDGIWSSYNTFVLSREKIRYQKRNSMLNRFPFHQLGSWQYRI